MSSEQRAATSKPRRNEDAALGPMRTGLAGAGATSEAVAEEPGGPLQVQGKTADTTNRKDRASVVAHQRERGAHGCVDLRVGRNFGVVRGSV